MRNYANIVSSLGISALFLFGPVFNRYIAIGSTLFQWKYVTLFFILTWWSICIFHSFRVEYLFLIALSFIALPFFIDQGISMNFITFSASVTAGSGIRILLNMGTKTVGNHAMLRIKNFLACFVILLTLASWEHLDVANNFYPSGTRWTGLWDNPNTYGMFMSVGLLLAVGLLVVSLKSSHLCSKATASQEAQSSMLIGSQKSEVRSLRFLGSFAALKSPIGDWQLAILTVAALMMGMGLIFSYSRGTWVGTVIGMLYLAKEYGKFRWKFVFPGVLIAAAVVFLFWNATPDKASWYMKRMDFSRPSAQHRVSAWKAGFEMMWDHPFGVGWNKAVETYEKNYSPPPGGAAAITTNDYLMLGTQIGIPTLLCFIAYVALRLRNQKPEKFEIWNLEFGIKTACRAAVIAMLVGFWFDGGLFKLATASVFWILLELGGDTEKRKLEAGKAETVLPQEGAKIAKISEMKS